MLPFSSAPLFVAPVYAVAHVRAGVLLEKGPLEQCLANAPVWPALQQAALASPQALDSAEIPSLRYQLLLSAMQHYHTYAFTFSTPSPDGGQHFLHLAVEREGDVLHTTGWGDCAAIDTTMYPDGTVHGRISPEMLAMPYYIQALPGSTPQHADIALCYYIPGIGPVHIGPASPTGRVALALAVRVKRLLHL